MGHDWEYGTCSECGMILGDREESEVPPCRDSADDWHEAIEVVQGSIKINSATGYGTAAGFVLEIDTDAKHIEVMVSYATEYGEPDRIEVTFMPDDETIFPTTYTGPWPPRDGEEWPPEWEETKVVIPGDWECLASTGRYSTRIVCVAKNREREFNLLHGGE